MRLIIDGNSLLNQALLRGIDHDQGRKVTDADGKEHQVNSADYGVDGFFEKYRLALEEFSVTPVNTIVVWDGRSAKARRQNILPQYKAGRDKIPEVSAELNAARDRVTQMVRDLGATVMYQDLLEADDVIGYLAQHLRDQPNTIITADGDLAVLVDDNTHLWRNGELDVNPCGPIPFKFVTLYKALVGDTSDKIPGAKGFGEGAFIDFVAAFGVDGLEEMQRMLLAGELDQLKESLDDFPRLKKILDDKDGVSASWHCARLHIENVNTTRQPLQILPGMVKQWDELPPEARDLPLRRYYGSKTLVHAGNYAAVKERLAAAVRKSPFVALDIETSSTDESDEWMEALKRATDSDRDRLDVLGHELTGMSLTFGDNLQHTIYMTVDHVEAEGVQNITVDQCREMCELIPSEKQIVIQNRAFEFSVLYRTWGTKWAGNGWNGLVPNAVDTKIGASYVDENEPKGLKERSLRHLGYQQTTYEETTTKRGPVGSLAGGRVKDVYDHEVSPAVLSEPDEGGNVVTLEPAVKEKWEAREYKMNELPAAHVFDYGCDDTICTASLHVFYRLVMVMEGTWQVYMDVEQLPEYQTSLAFVQGIPFSLPRLKEMERKDDAAYTAAWATLRAYLLSKGWDGTVCPEFEDPLEPSDIKLAVDILLDGEFTTRKRKLNAIAVDIREQFPDNAMASLLATAVEASNVPGINALLKDNFTGEPKINFGSTKQLQNLFYNVIGMRPRIVNRMTEKQRDNPVMVEAFRKFRRQKDGKAVEFTPEERDALLSKTSTDDAAVDTALVLDMHLGEAEKAALKAFQTIKKVMTRRSLFYKTYSAITHWRDGLIHPSLNQAEAVTRRYSSNNPNAQQWPKRGEGVEFRETIQPHHKDAVVVSIDWKGQELILLAHQSGDEALTSCFVGDSKRDVHSLTATKAAPFLWKEEVTYERFEEMRKAPKDSEDYARSKKLREESKTVNFASNYDAAAPNIAIQLMVDEETAQQFLDAKDAAFPRVSPWKDEVRADVEACGYATTMLGARRHLRAALTSENKWEASKAGRQGPNFKIQGSGAEMAKLAIGRVWKAGTFWGQRYDARFYCPVHDELVFSVHRDQVVDVIREVHTAMVQPYGDMKIPIIASISLGKNYGKQLECGDEFDEPAIRAAVNSIFEPVAEAA